MGEDRLRAPFEPLLAGCTRVAFGDVEALESALATRRHAGFVVEPIQCEGGVVLPPKGYFEAAARLCRKHGTLLIVDEVQTGLGRTGEMFATEVVPDVLVLAKALSGSIAPIAATLTTRKLHRRAYGATERFDLHGSTFAGGAFSCVAALETLRIIEDEGLVARSDQLGALLLDELRRRVGEHPLVRDIRGRGLLIGLELGPEDPGWRRKLSEKVLGQWIALRLLERGVVCQPCAHRWDVLKIEPPLTIDRERVVESAAAIEEVLGDYQGIGAVLRDVTKRLGGQFLRRWSF